MRTEYTNIMRNTYEFISRSLDEF